MIDAIKKGIVLFAEYPERLKKEASMKDKRTYWNMRYSNEGKIWGEPPSKICIKAAESFKLLGVESIMVPGCGYGRHSDYLASIGFRTVAFDISDAAISLAVQKEVPNALYINLDVLHLSDLSERFDAIYSFNLVHLFKKEIEHNTYKAKTGRPTHFYTDQELRGVLKDWEIIELNYHSELKIMGVGPREAQAKLSTLIRPKTPSLVLSHGKPVSFLVPYEETLDLLEMMDELKDQGLLEEIARARSEYAEGKEVPAERLFKKMGI